MTIQKDISLKKYNSFGIEVKADFMASFHDLSELNKLLEFKKDAPLLVLGGGSNILLTDDFKGIVLKNEIQGIEVVEETKDTILIKAGAGENWHRLVMYCVQHNYGGMENLSLIPGNVGASPMQNIGAYGVEIKDIFYELSAYDLKEGRVQIFSKMDCAFGYRESVFKNKYKGRYVILDVTFRLSKKPVFNTSYGAIEQELHKMNITEFNIQNISQAVINIRKSKLPDPLVIGNAGSFFKNPEVEKNFYDLLKSNYPSIPGFLLPDGKYKVPAGWLIEDCGWKGFRKGDAGCHKDQALVLVNYGHASGNEINSLATGIIKSVEEKFKITLEKEVNII